MPRKHNIASAPLLVRAGLSEHGLARAADEGNGLPLRVSAVGQCKFLEYAVEAMNDSAFGLHLAGQIDPRDVGMYFYAGSAARDLGEALALFSRCCRIVNEAFRLTQRSTDSAIVFEYVGLPRYAARHNMEYVVAAIGTASKDFWPQRHPTKVAFAHNRNSDGQRHRRWAAPFHKLEAPIASRVQRSGKASGVQTAHGTQSAADRNHGRHDPALRGAARRID